MPVTPPNPAPPPDPEQVGEPPPPAAPEDERVLDLLDVKVHPGQQIGSYTYLQRVAAGGMAHVVRARRDDGADVAIKILKSNRAGTGLARFHREFRALSKLRHDNIIRVADYGDLHGHAWFSMELVEGRDLHQEIRAWREIPLEQRWRRVEEVLVDLSRALAYIHRRGLVHRDLKPSNVLVDPAGRCKLTDFGIVKDIDPSADAFVSQTLVGTWAYASPEQLSGAPIDHRSDLYSLGVILYAMLTGRRPFVAKDMAGWLLRHRDQPPRPPREHVPGAPRHLEEICLRLLRKAPRDRFQSANDVLARLQAPEAPVPSDGVAPDEPLWEPPLTGRRFEADLLRDAVSALTRGEGGVLLLTGREGYGRSRMLRVATQHARRIGIPVHRAQLAANEGAFAGLVRIAEELGREVGAGAPPALSQARRAFAEAEGHAPGDLRYQLYDAVRTVLSELLTDGPVVLAVDDLHHAPAPLVGLLGYLVRTLVAREGLPLLLLATLRDDLPTPALKGVRDGTDLGTVPVRVELPPLDEDAVTVLVAAALGDGVEPGPLAARIAAETGGSPLLIVETLRALRDQGDDDVELETDEVTEVESPDLQIAPGVRQVVARQMARAPAQARPLIELLSAHGQDLELEVLLDAMELGGDPDEERIVDEIDALVDLGLVTRRAVGIQELVGLAHPRTAEVVHRDLPEPRRRLVHKHLAMALERRHAGRPAAAETIGEHYRRAHEPAAAWSFLVQAAVGLMQRSLLVEAEEVCERARRLEAAAKIALAESAFEPPRCALLRVRAAILFNRGRWPDARQALSQLRGLAMRAGDDHLAAEAGLDLGTVLCRLGLEDEGRAMVEAVLAGAEAAGDRPTALDARHRLASLSWEAGEQERCEELATLALAEATGPGLRDRRARLLTTLSAVQATRGQLSAAAAGLTEAAAIHQGLGNKRSGTIALGNLAEVRAMQGELAPAMEAAEGAVQLARAVLYREAEAFALRVRALVRLEVGQLAPAEDDLRAAAEILTDLSLAGDAVPVLYLQARIALDRGELEPAAAHLRQGLDAAAHQDPELYRPVLQALQARAAALSGQPAAARERLRALQADLPLLPAPRRAQLCLEMAEAWALLGEPDAAAGLIGGAAEEAEASGLRPAALRARLLQAQVAAPPQDREAQLAAAELARGLLEGLPADLALAWQARPDLEGLWLLDTDDL